MVLWRPDEVMCTAAALKHTIEAVRGRVVARVYYKKLRSMRPLLENITRIVEILHQMNTFVPDHLHARVQMQELKKMERAALQENLFRRLVGQTSRCFLCILMYLGR